MKDIMLINTQTGEVRAIPRATSRGIKALFVCLAGDADLANGWVGTSLEFSIAKDVRFEVDDKRLEGWLNAEKNRKYGER